MTRLRAAWLMSISACLQMGCQSAGSAGVPARMGTQHITSACIAQMQKFITAKEGLGTLLTPAAFAQDSFLSITEMPITDATGLLAQGRERNLPQIYRLSRSAGACTITRERDGASAVLDSCSCTPLC